MRLRHQISAAVFVTGLALAGVTGASVLAVAQTAAPTAAAKPDRPHHSHIEGRIAFLKTELKITDAQAAQWDAVAAAMRQNSQAMHQAFEKMHADHGTAHNAVNHFEMAAQLASLRADSDQRMLAAFKPLYASLSDEQKATADELFARHRHFHHR